MKVRVTSSSDDVKLSLVLPVFNEEDNVVRVIERSEAALRRLGYKYEIIVVNDGSCDDTMARLHECCLVNGDVRVVSYWRNVGKGYAVKKGFSAAVGEYVVFMDGDLEVNPGYVGRYVEALKRGDIVIGSKRHPDSRVVAPPLRRFLSWGFNLFVRLLTGLRLRDTQSGLKAVRRSRLVDVFRVLAVKRFAFDVELLAVSHLYGLRIVEMPVEITLTKGVFNPREVVRMLVDLMAIKWRLVSGKYGVASGLV